MKILLNDIENNIKLVQAINKVKSMKMIDKESLIDEIYLEQPVILSSILVQNNLGNTFEQIDILLNILLVTYVYNRVSKISISKISEHDYEKIVNDLIKEVNNSTQFNNIFQNSFIEIYINNHPNKNLLAYSILEMKKAGFHKLSYENSKYLFIAGMGIVNALSKK